MEMRSFFSWAVLTAGTSACLALGCGGNAGGPVGEGSSSPDASVDGQATPPPPPPDAGAEANGAAGAGAGVDAGSFSGLCDPKFASGVNVAWIHFANDVPGPNLADFNQLFQNTHAAGGTVARWWFHTNGTRTPGYDSNGMALPISDANIADVKSILDAARANGMMVTISLWSFDMLKAQNLPNDGGPTLMTNNIDLLTVDANRQAYIDNVLTPLVHALAGYPGLFAWETFNEPEGMASGQSWKPFTGTGGQSVDESFIQKSVNWFAAAIHDADPNARVTNGTWEFQANSNAGGMTNFYSDAALQNAGGKANGTLDSYEVHYYSSNGSKFSPFLNPASHWGLDKPVLIGEFYALAQDNVAAADTYTTLYQGGYAGAWAWQYWNADGNNTSNMSMVTKWPAMQLPMQNLQSLAPGAIACP